MSQIVSALIGAAAAIVVCVIQSNAQNQKRQAEFDKAIGIIEYKIDVLTAKVAAHNNLIDRMYKVEQTTSLQEEQIKVANHRIDDLEKKGA